MTVHLAVYDTMADWECGHVAAHLPGGVRTVGPTGAAITTKAGLHGRPDMPLTALRPDDSEMLILPGAELWFGDTLTPFTRTAREFLAAGVPVAAICGATYGLAAEDCSTTATTPARHPSTWRRPGTPGTARYRDVDAVHDRDVITAGPTDPVAFAGRSSRGSVRSPRTSSTPGSGSSPTPTRPPTRSSRRPRRHRHRSAPGAPPADATRGSRADERTEHPGRRLRRAARRPAGRRAGPAE